LADVNDIFYKTLCFNIASGLLAGQTEDRKYININGKTKFQCFAEDVMSYADAVMQEMDKRLVKENSDAIG